MKNKKAIFSILMAIGASQAFALPGGSAQHASKAVKHSGKALSHTVVSAGKVASGAVAVPLLVIGNLGPVSAAAGEALWDNATQQKPLTITDKTITADPAPQFALRKDSHTASICDAAASKTRQTDKESKQRKTDTKDYPNKHKPPVRPDCI
jgi:hypothetical protein